MTFPTLNFKFRYKAWVFSGLMAVLVLGHGGVAFAQSDRDLQDQMSRMENEIRTLSRAVYSGDRPAAGGGAGAASSGGDAVIQMQRIEGEMQELRGLLEQQSYEIRELKADFERTKSDLELRMNDLEGQGNASGSSSFSSGVDAIKRNIGVGDSDDKPAPYAASRSSDEKPDGYSWGSGDKSEQRLGSLSATGDNADTPSATYDNAFSLVKNNQYAQAQREFEAFLKSYPEHSLAGNAKYWLGETHYVRGDFETAARIFAEGYKQFPKGSKSGDNLLKLALSLESLDKKKDACVALGQLKKESQSAGGVILRRANQEISRIGC